MFGTVARMKLKPGSHEKMQDLMKGFEERQVNGFVFTASYRSQSDPDEIWLAVGFEDEASYRANAWHDGEIVSMNRAEDRAPTTRS
jgi:hypothetical protein